MNYEVFLTGRESLGGKKGAAPQPEADPSPIGAVGPGNTQLYMIRSSKYELPRKYKLASFSSRISS